LLRLGDLLQYDVEEPVRNEALLLAAGVADCASVCKVWLFCEVRGFVVQTALGEGGPDGRQFDGPRSLITAPDLVETQCVTGRLGLSESRFGTVHLRGGQAVLRPTPVTAGESTTLLDAVLQCLVTETAEAKADHDFIPMQVLHFLCQWVTEAPTVVQALRLTTTTASGNSGCGGDETTIADTTPRRSNNNSSHIQGALRASPYRKNSSRCCPTCRCRRCRRMGTHRSNRSPTQLALSNRNRSS
jgi:hypothetical protein